MPRPPALPLFLVLIVAALAIVPAHAFASSPAYFHFEGGLGLSAVSGLGTGSWIVGAGAGVGVGAGRAAVAAFEFSALRGDDGGVHLPEGPSAGSRSIVTFLIGVEAYRSATRGSFTFLGVGVGHVTLKNALDGGWQDFPNNRIPPRNDIGFATGVGIGHRFAGGPGPLGFQVAFRTHAVVKEGQSPAVACTITLGLAH